MSKSIRLIKNLVILVLLIAGAYLIYNYFNSKEDRFELLNSPIKIEQIRSIAEISTVSYKDEVVEDSVEFYTSISDKVSSNLLKMTDLDYWKYGIRQSNIKRRLTLIIQGEVLIGFDLKENPIQVDNNNDSIFIILPSAKVLDVLVSPSKTEIFQENGEWKDFERKKLEKRAIAQLKLNALELDLIEKANANMERLMTQLIPDNRTLIIAFR